MLMKRPQCDDQKRWIRQIDDKPFGTTTPMFNRVHIGNVCLRANARLAISVGLCFTIRCEHRRRWNPTWFDYGPGDGVCVAVSTRQGTRALPADLVNHSKSTVTYCIRLLWLADGRRTFYAKCFVFLFVSKPTAQFGSFTRSILARLNRSAVWRVLF